MSQGNIFSSFANNADWFEHAERIALSALENGLNADQIKEQLEAMEPLQQKTHEPELIEQTGWLCQSNSTEAMSHLLYKSQSQTAVSIWETRGSQNQNPATFIAKGMPPAHYYTFMITGQWAKTEKTF